jgi:hypothetical protein
MAKLQKTSTCTILPSFGPQAPGCQLLPYHLLLGENIVKPGIGGKDHKNADCDFS